MFLFQLAATEATVAAPVVLRLVVYYCNKQDDPGTYCGICRPLKLRGAPATRYNLKDESQQSKLHHNQETLLVPPGMLPDLPFIILFLHM